MKNEIICTCMEIDLETIVKAIHKNNFAKVDEVMDATGAGTVCGGCIDKIQEIINTLIKTNNI